MEVSAEEAEEIAALLKRVSAQLERASAAAISDLTAVRDCVAASQELCKITGPLQNALSSAGASLDPIGAADDALPSQPPPQRLLL